MTLHGFKVNFVSVTTAKAIMFMKNSKLQLPNKERHKHVSGNLKTNELSDNTVCKPYDKDDLQIV